MPSGNRSGLAVALVAGCSSVIQGHAARTPPIPAESALPSTVELSQTLGSPMRSDGPAAIGGIESLRNDDETPDECSGITHSAMRQTYTGARVRGAAKAMWTAAGHSGGVPAGVTVGIAELDSPSNAMTWYARVAAQWQRCLPQTVVDRIYSETFITNIMRVDDSGRLITASLVLSTTDGSMTTTRQQRAFTFAGQYLVDVDILGCIRCAVDNDKADDAANIAKLVVSKVVEQ